MSMQVTKRSMIRALRQALRRRDEVDATTAFHHELAMADGGAKSVVTRCVDPTAMVAVVDAVRALRGERLKKADAKRPTTTATNKKPASMQAPEGAVVGTRTVTIAANPLVKSEEQRSWDKEIARKRALRAQERNQRAARLGAAKAALETKRAQLKAAYEELRKERLSGGSVMPNTNRFHQEAFEQEVTMTGLYELWSNRFLGPKRAVLSLELCDALIAQVADEMNSTFTLRAWREALAGVAQ